MVQNFIFVRRLETRKRLPACDPLGKMEDADPGV